MADWDIKPLGESCRACSRPFEDGETCYSTITFGPEGCERADYCDTCWFEWERPNSGYSAWRGVYRAPAPEPEEPVKKENAESLLRRLMKDENPEHRNVVYILAVMLERRRLLTHRDTQVRDDGTKLIVYEHKKTGETFLVPDPDLALDSLREVQQQVVAMLDGRL
ncbi:MAG: hypothetical protein R6V03_00430 [Kiritimatiellia bacterium]